VARWHSSAQIVVIHRREIVVNERENMNHLKGAGGIKSGVSFGSKSFGRGQTERRPNALSGRKAGIPHGRMKGLGLLID
jgi:hypothetical protein